MAYKRKWKPGKNLPQQDQALVDLVTKAKNDEMDWNSYWQPNIQGFVNDSNFIYHSTNTPKDLEILALNNQPQVQFNITQPFVIREVARFAEMQPYFQFKIRDGFPLTPVNQLLCDYLSGYFQLSYKPSNNNYAFTTVRKDAISGGFSGLKMGHAYLSDYTTEQHVTLRAQENPCIVGYDPTSKHITKKDGDFAFERIFTKKSEIRRKYGKEAADAVDTRASKANVGYPDRLTDDETICLTYYWYKEYYTEKLVKLSTGAHMPKALADEVIKSWKPGLLQVKPTIIEERDVERYKICLLVYAENGYVLEHDKDTIYNDFPLIYVDGKSELLAADTDGIQRRQVTSSMIRSSVDIQRTKNAMGQAILASTQNIGVTRWLVSQQAMPKQEELKNAYQDPDAARVVIWNEVDQANPNSRNSPPREVDFPGAKPEQFQMFTYMDTLFQAANAIFDPSTPSIASNDMSGKAIIAGDAQAQMMAQPGMLGIIGAMEQAARIELHMMTKLIRDERELQYSDNGVDIKTFKVNEAGGIMMDFDANMFDIQVTLGVSTELQKTHTLEALMDAAKVMPSMNAFLNDPEIVPHILRLVPGANLDNFILAYDAWLKKQQSQPPQPNPQQMQMQVEQEKINLGKESNRIKEAQMILDAVQKKRDQQIKEQEMIINAQSASERDDATVAAAFAKIDESVANQEIARQDRDAENVRSSIDAMKLMNEEHREQERHEMAKAEHFKRMNESSQEKENVSRA